MDMAAHRVAEGFKKAMSAVNAVGELAGWDRVTLNGSTIWESAAVKAAKAALAAAKKAEKEAAKKAKEEAEQEAKKED